MPTDNRTKIAGAEYWFFIDPTGGEDYSIVVCLESHSLSLSNSASTKTTYCGSVSTPGDQTKSWDMSGIIVKDPTTGEISAPDLFTLAQNKSTFGWKSAKGVDPTNADFIREGKGFFTSYSEGYTSTDFATFSGTVSVDGDITQEFETVSQ